MKGRTGWLSFLLFALLMTTTATAPALTQLPVKIITNEIVIERYLEELDDPLGRFDISDVTHKPLISTFRRLGKADSGRITRCRWYRVILDPHLEQQGPLVLFTRESSAVLFEPTLIGYHAESFGVDTLASERRLHNDLHDVDIRHGDYGRVLYIRINGPTVHDLTLRTFASVMNEERELDLIGTLFGTIFGVLMICAFIFAAITRTRAMAYYGMYMGTQMINQIDDIPITSHFVMFQSPGATFVFRIVYVLLSPLLYTLFCRNILDIRKSRLLDGLVLGIGFLSAFVAVTCVSLDHYFGSNYLFEVVPPLAAVTLLLSLYIALLRWRQRYVSAGLFVLGILGVIVSFVAWPTFGRYVDLPDIGFVWEALFFLAAIAYRIVVVTKGREAALAESVSAKGAVSRALAERVHEAEQFNAAFARFVPREFLRLLGREDVRSVELGDHVEREMTVLFCDIRSFVAFSEGRTPQATFAFLNQYFGRVGPIVRAHNGFIDKYLGDGVMAIFPESPDDAVRAAIALHAEVRRFNEARAREGERSIEVGVALHSGNLMLATIGEGERYDTTVVADVVNIASRLEGVTKVYGAAILISDAVVKKLADPRAYNLRWLGEIQVVGSKKPISSYEVCDGDGAALVLHKRLTAEEFARGIVAYRDGNFGTGTEIFDDIVKAEPHDAVARFFADRSHQRLSNGEAIWDGVERHYTKS